MRSKARLVVHIGGSKCGSTAIQFLLGSNREKLASQGFLIPDQNLEMIDEKSPVVDQVQFFQKFSGNLDEGREIVRERLFALSEVAVRRDAKSIILSAENLSNPEGFEKLFVNLSEEFDIKIVMYVRRQDDWFQSAWQQWFLKGYPDFWTWCLSVIGDMANWRTALEPWLGMFGREAIIVRRFDKRAFFKANLLSDFCEAVGIQLDGLLIPNVVNPSYNETVTALANSVQDVFSDIHDNRFYEMIYRFGGKDALKSSTEEFLTDRQKSAIMEHYKQCNAWVLQTFFPNATEGDLLFESHHSDKNTRGRNGDSIILSPNVISPTSKLLTRLVFNLYCECMAVREILKRNDIK